MEVCSQKRAKGQLSAEMIILIAVVLAVVAIVALSMTNAANKGSAAVDSQSGHIINRTSDIVGNFSAPVPAVQAQPVAALAGK